MIVWVVQYTDSEGKTGTHNMYASQELAIAGALKTASETIAECYPDEPGVLPTVKAVQGTTRGGSPTVDLVLQYDGHERHDLTEHWEVYPVAVDQGDR